MINTLSCVNNSNIYICNNNVNKESSIQNENSIFYKNNSVHNDHKYVTDTNISNYDEFNELIKPISSINNNNNNSNNNSIIHDTNILYNEHNNNLLTSHVLLSSTEPEQVRSKIEQGPLINEYNIKNDHNIDYYCNTPFDDELDKLHNFLKNFQKILFHNGDNLKLKNDMLEKLYENKLSKKMLSNLKTEYNCDEIIYKLICYVNNIRKDRKRYKDEEKICIIHEKLDIADIIQNKIFKYNFLLEQLEEHINQLFEKKKIIHQNNNILTHYVICLLKIIIRNIYENRRYEKKYKIDFFENKKKHIQNDQDDVCNREKNVVQEEENFIKQKEELQEQMRNINDNIKDTNMKYETQIQQIDEEIISIDKHIKELEQKIEQKKNEKKQAQIKKNKLQIEQTKQLNELIDKQSDINTSFQLIQNSFDILNKEKQEITCIKENIDKQLNNLKTIYQNCNENKNSTQVFLNKLKNNLILVCKNKAHTMIYPSTEDVQQVYHNNENNQNISNNNNKELIKITQNDKLFMNNNNNNNNNKTNNVNNNYNAQNAKCLKKIFFLKKELFDMAKNINNIKEKKKKLVIDINQLNCEVDNINIKKENLKNKKKILLKSKMLNEVKNTINEFDELLLSENNNLKLLENFKQDMNELKTKHIMLKDKKEKLKRKLYALENKLLKSEICFVKISQNIKYDQKLQEQRIEQDEKKEKHQIIQENINNESIQNNVHDINNANEEKPIDDIFIFSDESDNYKDDIINLNMNEIIQKLKDEEKSYNEEGTSQTDNNSIQNDKNKEESIQNDKNKEEAIQNDKNKEEAIQNDKNKDLKEYMENNEQSMNQSDDNALTNTSYEIKKNDDVINKEEDDIMNGEIPNSNYINELHIILKELKIEENKMLENIIERYKIIYGMNKEVDYNMLEEDVSNFHNSITHEENMLKNKKLALLRKKRNILKMYYSYSSDNSEDDE
ncbi:hypothetical protein PFFCH_00396 [Plasmodium falciparum FCH/4]|uniref:Uncharacterized protein n=1 Tax=Plasmodium falciparum FCH/4 TaxID=1036724 RepID=A0A024VV22_PLAFA|nr:hypothetical protein PFFCH_00396 [Plasmodium falciparum FCH/4]